MVGRTQKRSSTPKPTTSTTVTGRRVKRRPEAKPTTAAKPKKAVRTRTVIKPTKASKPRTAAKPKKTTKPGASAKRKAVPPATRAQRPSLSTVKKSVTFTLNAPNGLYVAVAGAFNNWEPQAMTKGPNGVRRITLQLPPGSHEYKFLVGAQWLEDPNNPRKTPNEQGGYNSVCEVM